MGYLKLAMQLCTVEGAECLGNLMPECLNHMPYWLESTKCWCCLGALTTTIPTTLMQLKGSDELPEVAGRCEV